MAKKKIKSNKVKSSSVKKVKSSRAIPVVKPALNKPTKVEVSTKIRKLTWKDYLGLIFYAVLIIVILLSLIYLVKFQDNIIGWATSVKTNQQITLALGESAQYQVNGQIYDLSPIAKNEDNSVKVHVSKYVEPGTGSTESGSKTFCELYPDTPRCTASGAGSTVGGTNGDPIIRGGIQ